MARVVLNQPSTRIENEVAIKRKIWFKAATLNSCAVVTYLIISIGMTFYQRSCLTQLDCPLTLVSSHMLLKFIFSAIARWIWSWMRKRRQVVISLNDSITQLAPPGFAAGLDIAFSNWGLVFIDVSLYTMTKSTSIIFILIFALFLRLEKKSCCVFLIVAMISGGLIMFTYKSTQFAYNGFVLVLIASVASGLRWTLSQVIMQQTNLGIHNPFDMMFYTQPWMFIIVLPFAAIFEGPKLLKMWVQNEYDKLHMALKFMSVGGTMGFFLEANEYLVVDRTSSLTLAVASVIKEAITLLLAVELSNYQMTAINTLGLLLCLSGVVTHVIHKARTTMKESYNRDLVSDEASALFLPFQVDSSEELDEMDEDNSSTEVLFNVIQNRDWSR